MSSCLTPEDFERFAKGLLDEDSSAALRNHLGLCASCRTAYAEHTTGETIVVNRNDDMMFVDGADVTLDVRRVDETIPVERGGAALDRTQSFDSAVTRVTSRIKRMAEHYPKIDGYNIVGVVGQGGMGIVYKAIQTKLNRTVALKVLPAIVGSANPAAVARFRREATSAARLHHTNIIPIYDFGESSDASFYAMELISGEPLDKIIHRIVEQSATASPHSRLARLFRTNKGDGARTNELEESGSSAMLPVEAGATVSLSPALGRSYYRQIARWMADTADGLNYAHEQGIIHRDIKPANLIVSEDGRIMIADFGLAKAMDEETITQTGTLMGTLRYMSPEQAMAKRVPLDHRTDIYSLGVTLYELLAFRPVFADCAAKELLGKIISADPTRPRKINAAAPSELETICLKMMEKSADARYPTAKELADDLRRYVSDLPIAAKRPNFIKRAIKFTRRHKAPVAAVTIGVFLMVATLLALRFQKQWKIEGIAQLNESGMRHDNLSEWVKGEDAFQAALEIDPDNAEVLSNLAILYKNQFNLDRPDVALLEKADVLCRRALSIAPTHFKVLNTHGVILKKLERYEESIATLQKVIELAPNYFPVWANLGMVYASQGDLEAAEAHLRKSTELPGTDTEYGVEPWRNLASLQIYLRDAGAADSIKSGIRCNKHDVGVWLLSARLHMTMDGFIDYERALDHVKKLCDENGESDDPKVMRMVALGYMRNDRFEKAIQFAQKALGLGDMEVINHLIIAVAEARLGNIERARGRLVTAESTWPEELKSEGNYLATADKGVLWFETADELFALRGEATELLDNAPR
ncbi:MAG: protein kinase [Planctomycetes bacterium]|nr:protein kinase [Planctomycetota bacterium]